jgi:hypothetical protein
MLDHLVMTELDSDIHARPALCAALLLLL